MSTTNQLLQVNIQLMRLLNLWPTEDVKESKFWRTFKDISIIVGSIPCIFGICWDFIIQIQGKFEDILDITENFTALGALFGMIYIIICFVKNRERIKIVVYNLKDFKEFQQGPEMILTDKKSSLATKVFIFYGIFGVLCYQAVPFATMHSCKARRQQTIYSKDMPCGLITRYRLPFKYEDSSLVYAVIFSELFSSLMATTITLATTMFLVSVLMQIIAQMKQLRKMLRKNLRPLHECVRYHNIIIEYSSNVTKAFSSMMLMHITLTSFEISVLGFEVLMMNNRSDSVRFGMHLFGWLMLLFLICFYGQKLIDESTGIGWDAYCTEWYYGPVSVQKDLQLMILRSQKPLTLSAASLGVMSLETFLGVLSTAYSYFTLLLNMKN